MNDDQRQIKGYVRSEATGNRASWGKSVHKGHIPTPHLWKAQQSPAATWYYNFPAKAVESAAMNISKEI